MSSPAVSFVASPPRVQRLEVLFEELAELTGQRNAIDGRIVDIVAEIDRDGLWATTGARSVAALTAWKLGVSSTNANIIAAVAHRLEEFPRCTEGLRQGRLSLDQVGVIAGRAGTGSDAHYAELAAVATVNQLRTAVKLEPRPEPELPPTPESPPTPGSDADPDSETDVDFDADFEAEAAPRPAPRLEPSISTTSDEESTTWRIQLPHAEAALFDAALASHLDALVAGWKRDHDTRDPADRADSARVSDQAPPFPRLVDAFMSLIEAGWDTEVAARPHSHRTTVIAHLDVEHQVAALHLGPLLSDQDRRYLLCDATCQVWFERHGQPIGAGRDTRTISRRLRRALQHRDRCCVVPGCGATRGLHGPPSAALGKTAAPPSCPTWF